MDRLSTREEMTFGEVVGAISDEEVLEGLRRGVVEDMEFWGEEGMDAVVNVWVIVAILSGWLSLR